MYKLVSGNLQKDCIIFQKPQVRFEMVKSSHRVHSLHPQGSLPGQQTVSCSAAVWPGCQSAHTFVLRYQSHSIFLLMKQPMDTGLV